MDQDNDYYYRDSKGRKAEVNNEIVYDYLDSCSSSDDSPLINYKYNKKRFAPYVPVKNAEIPYSLRERERRWPFSVLAKFFLFCSAMILFCVLMYIPVYNKANDQLPKGIVTGWTTHTNRDTKVYVQPNNLTTIHEPKTVCSDNLFLLIVVCSATQNFKKRQAIRETWGNYDNYMKMDKLFGEVKSRYKNYNFSSDLYPVRNNSSKRKQRSVSFGAILPNLAQALKAKLKTNRVDKEGDNLFFNFDMNKDLNYYDYDSNIMKIPPKDVDYGDGVEMSNKIEKIVSLLKENFNVTEIEKTDNIFKLVFILGLPTEGNDTQLKIDEEINKYGDIIQEDFVDSYNNLTLKSVMMLKWVLNHCQDTVRYIMKTDDDMFINTPNLISTLRNKSQEYDKHKKQDEKEILLIGDLIYGARPVADSNNKWYSPKYMYSGRVYPRYLSGTGYALSIHTAKLLYEAALRTPYFHLEDIYITGLCAARARPRIKARDDPGFTYQVSPAVEPCSVYAHVTSHRVQEKALGWLTRDLMQERTVDICERIRLTRIRRDRLRAKATKKPVIRMYRPA